MNITATAVSVSLIPFLAIWVALYLPIKFSKNTTSITQAVAAGFILGGVMTDLLPRILQDGMQLSYIISFIIGFAFMLFLQHQGGDCCDHTRAKQSLRQFLFPFYMEFLVTGVLLGIAASASAALLIIIAISFSLCNLVCSLSISSKLSTLGVNAAKRFYITASMSLILPIAAFLTATFVARLSLEWVNDLLAFAIATLLYLLLNEMLPQALETKKSRGLAIIFSSISFVFLLLFVIK